MVALPVWALAAWILYLFFPAERGWVLGGTALGALLLIEYAGAVHRWLPDRLAGRLGLRTVRLAGALALFLCLLRIVSDVVLGPVRLAMELVP